MEFNKITTLVTCFILAMLVSACSSHIPPEISLPLDNAPTIQQVHDNPNNYLSQKVRWGGVILSNENKQQSSWLTIVAFPLSDGGKPQVSDQSPGRFIAIADEFLEPLVYKRDREVTLTGTVIRTETIKVGGFPYEYPVIKVDHYYLWPLRTVYEGPDYDPYWRYSPYYPYYPYYPWSPYYYPRPHIHRK